VPSKFKATLIKNIHQLQKEHNIWIITIVDSLQHSSKETSLTQSKELIDKLEESKEKETKRPYPHSWFKLASAISKKLKQKLQLVGYINTSEQERSMTNEILSYISMIA
jgi:hypothetical protein